MYHKDHGNTTYGKCSVSAPSSWSFLSLWKHHCKLHMGFSLHMSLHPNFLFSRTQVILDSPPPPLAAAHP